MRLASLIAFAMLVAVLPVRAEDGGWFTAENQACRLWHPQPYEDQKVRWYGECRDGKAHGKGSAEWFVYQRPPDRCDCTYVDGKPEGEGIYRWSDGVIYIGEFKGGIREGNGYIRYPDNESYEGEFRNGLPNGWGLQIQPDSTRVMGKFKDGVHIQVD